MNEQQAAQPQNLRMGPAYEAFRPGKPAQPIRPGDFAWPLLFQFKKLCPALTFQPAGGPP